MSEFDFPLLDPKYYEHWLQSYVDAAKQSNLGQSLDPLPDTLLSVRFTYRKEVQNARQAHA